MTCPLFILMVGFPGLRIMRMGGLLGLVCGPFLLAGVVMLIARYVTCDSAVALRTRLTARRMRLLAFLVAFSPAMMSRVAATEIVGQLLRPFAGMPPAARVFIVVSFVLGPFSTAALSACWLTLSPHAAEPLRVSRAFIAAFCIWLINMVIILL